MVKIDEDLLKENFVVTFLAQVAFEIRFPTDLSIRNKIVDFQGSIKDDFPSYSEGYKIPISFGSKVESSNLINYRFSNPEKNGEIYINEYSVFGLRTKKYQGFDVFFYDFFKYVKKFIDLVKIKLISRIGIRYVNIFPLDKDVNESNKKINLYFKKIIKTDIENQNFSFQNIDLRYNSDIYEIHQKSGLRKRSDGSYEYFIDLDNSFNENIEIEENKDELSDKVSELHKLIKVKFFNLINEQFLNLLRGKEVI